MNNKNTTNKKDNVVIDWPTSHFTIDDVWNKIGGEAVMPNITLRFRVKKALENKEIVSIGKIKPAIGRPKLVFARTNPSRELLEAAKVAGVISNETLAAVTIAEVKSEKKTKAVIPATAATSDGISTRVKTAG
jgi:predicted ArsR family transcriptional regulator